MFTILWRMLCVEVFLLIDFTSANQVLPQATTLLERERWQSIRGRRSSAIDNQQEPENIHLHRVDGVDPFARLRRFDSESWIQQGYNTLTSNSTCQPFSEIRKDMEELHARAKETTLELIAALGRMQAQTQLEKTAIDKLIEAQKGSNSSLQRCEEQKATALSNAEKYGKELKELQEIAQSDAAIFNISGKATSPGSASSMPSSLLQRGLESQNVKRLGTTDEFDVVTRPVISLAEAQRRTEVNNVEEAAKELQDCLAQLKQYQPSVGPTESPEKCATHKERLKKMFAAAYAHIARIKEKYEDLADDDSCDKAAHEEFSGREGSAKEELNATRRHLCSVHNTMTELTQDAKELNDKANALDKTLVEAGCALPACPAAKGWPTYHRVVLDLASLIDKHPACVKCCQDQSTESLLQAEQQQNSMTLLQEEIF